MSDDLQPVALAVADWGTSSLRVWVLSDAGKVLGEQRSDDGMARLEPDGFEPALRRCLDALIPESPPMLPVMVCGMAGARQGWREAGYVGVPAEPSEICRHALRIPASGLDVRILPGLAERRPGAEDVMRGEETQLLGLLLKNEAQSGIVCLPGTHSKWVRLDSGRVAGFRTAMTGELFGVLSQHSVLRHSVQGAPSTGDPGSPGFMAGLQCGLRDPARLLSALFGVRAGGLLRDIPGHQAADTLSGLLIGAEIAGAAPPGPEVTLVATGALAELYRCGLEAAGLTVRLIDSTLAVQRGLLFAARQTWPERLS